MNRFVRHLDRSDIHTHGEYTPDGWLYTYHVHLWGASNAPDCFYSYEDALTTIEHYNANTDRVCG